MDRALDLRLQEIRGRTLPVDPILARLVNVCTRQDLVLQLGLVAVVGGCLVRGVPTQSSAMSDLIDGGVRQFFDVLRRGFEAAGTPHEGLTEMAADFTLFGDAARTKAASRIETRDRLVALGVANPLDAPHTLPEDLQDDALQFSLPPKAVTLEQAQVRYPSGEWEDVGVLRVLLSQVSAWWTFPLEEAPSETDA